jgi:hypothetical protein
VDHRHSIRLTACWSTTPHQPGRGLCCPPRADHHWAEHHAPGAGTPEGANAQHCPKFDQKQEENRLAGVSCMALSYVCVAAGAGGAAWVYPHWPAWSPDYPRNAKAVPEPAATPTEVLLSPPQTVETLPVALAALRGDGQPRVGLEIPTRAGSRPASQPGSGQLQPGNAARWKKPTRSTAWHTA